MDKSNIVLIGMPASGKSTLGKGIAKRLGMKFVDTDSLLQLGSDEKISQFIEEHGHEAFVDYENAILCGLMCKNHVIATGGSAIYGHLAMQHLLDMGLIVFVDISKDEMKSRVGNKISERGIIMREGISSLDELYSDRHQIYLDYADVVVSTDNLSTREAIDLIVESIEDYKSK
ncbi:MAG: hypothetical protein MJ189_04960 [Coriobacteriales bacterium]|nr:hypothetical protein [Coriobacteriales bacterium]